jgi:hypothetical protein
VKLTIEVIDQTVPQLLLWLAAWLYGHATRAVRRRLDRPPADSPIGIPPSHEPRTPAPNPASRLGCEMTAISPCGGTVPAAQLDETIYRTGATVIAGRLASRYGTSQGHTDSILPTTAHAGRDARPRRRVASTSKSADGPGQIADITFRRGDYDETLCIYRETIADNNSTTPGVMDGSIYLYNDIAAHGWSRVGADGRTRILMLAANPGSTPRLALDEEAREITEKLRLSQNRDSFELITCWAVRPADLLQQLNQHRPHIVHFSGHGDQSGEIALSTGRDSDQHVSTAALVELFRTMKDDIRIVVLNACYSTIQAQAISQHIDYIVGMRAPIGDQAAAVFAAAFYSALGFQRTVAEAFDQAKTALMMYGMPDQALPELITRPEAAPYVGS